MDIRPRKLLLPIKMLKEASLRRRCLSWDLNYQEESTCRHQSERTARANVLRAQLLVLRQEAASEGGTWEIWRAERVRSEEITDTA